MNKEQALQVIEQALQIANSKGSFKLDESAAIYTALSTIKNVFTEPLPTEIGPQPKLGKESGKEEIRTVSK